MDNGIVAEYGTPKTLVNNPSSLFSGFIDQTGENNAILLRKLANEGASLDLLMDVEAIVKE